MPILAHPVPRSGYRELFLTALPGPGPAPAAACLQELAAALQQLGAEVIAEKVYGTLRQRAAVLAARETALRARGRDPATPVHYLDGAPVDDRGFGGVQVWAVADDGGGARVANVDGGRLLTLPGARWLHLAAVRGQGHAPFAAQAEAMFLRAAELARRHGFRYAQTARTWIYLGRLLADYADLNRVRTAFYQRHEVDLPASTGIQAEVDGAACSMDLLLVDGVQRTRIDRTLRQGPASAYGSAFARGVLLEHGAGRTLHVSGTASIDGDGRSRHDGDAAAQYLETLVDVAAVLREAGMGLADLVQGTLFVKTAAVAAACRQVHELLGLPPLPLLVVHADVCRPELLVELEAVACR